MKTPMTLAALNNTPAAEKLGAQRVVESFQEEKTRREREREQETRRENLAVEILLGETRRIYVCSHTQIQFELFRRKLAAACEEMRIPQKNVRRVDRFGDELRGVVRGRSRIVLLNSWDMEADRHLKDQVEWLTREEEALRT
jgi:hypothetical protein